MTKRTYRVDGLEAAQRSPNRLEKIRQRADLRYPSWSDTLYCFTVIDELKEALITIADRLEDEGCQCDASDEYVYKCNLCIANNALRTTIPSLNPDKG